MKTQTNTLYTITTNILSNFKQTLNLRSFSSVQLNTSKTNNFEMSSIKLPSLNSKRNQIRLTNTVKALTLFINSMSGLNDSSKVALVSVLHRLEMFYFRDNTGFVKFCKLHANWYTVNMFKNIRTQDAIDKADWNELARVPTILLPIGMQIDAVNSKAELFMIHRLVLSIFNIYTVVLTPTHPKLNTITDPFRGDESVLQRIDIDRALERLNISPDKITSDFITANKSADWHSSSASGPNGQAVWMSHQDAKAILKDETLSSHIEALSTMLERQAVWDILKLTVTLPSFFNIMKEDAVHSKLHFIFEKGDKTRTIAIVDYFTQELLSPFHSVINSVLKTISMDGTFNQEAIAEQVRVMTSNKQAELFSLDLTAATDRLPIRLQIMIIDKLVKIKGFGELWAKVLVDRDFTLPGNVGTIRYAVGQPMGAKSSFAMLALTHHIIVQEAAALAGLASFSGYVILGDDIVIANKLVADNYKEIMKGLGLELAPFKSIESTQLTSSFQVAEIAKRLFADGSEVTALPVKLIANTIDNGSLGYQLQEEMGKRGLITNPQAFGAFMRSILRSQVDFKTLLQLNILPSFMTGMKYSMNMTGLAQFTLDTWLNSNNLRIEDLNNFFMFTVLQEQMKRMSTIIQNSDTTFDILQKAVKVTDTQFLSSGVDDFIPAKTYLEEHGSQWQVVKTLHPAREVMFSEVNRISTFIMQLSVTHGYDLMNSLLNNLIDSLKVSVIEIVKDRRIGSSNVDRTLITKTLANIKQAQNDQSKTLQFVAKFNPMNVTWYAKVTIGGTCSVSRSTSTIATTQQDSILELNKAMKQINLMDLL